ncbi:hypothetical protein [Methylobacterium sp. Leaf111]|uniref:hypothetical protein n=1 Tax=Methylobacterium sp. Leaf111 TaxID=1736257 RepID=UPI000AFF458F|nr:hypothetical protein [Methylobacterium sp. Leaf111]
MSINFVQMKRKSDNERIEIVAAFESYISRGVTVKEAALQAGAPLSTIYRWQKAFGSDYEPVKRSADFGLSIADAIKKLVSTDDLAKSALLEACFKFMVWLRWPNKENEHQTLICSCMAAYCSAKGNAQSLAQIDTEYKQVILDNLNLDVLVRLSSVEGSATPWFYMDKIQDRRYTSADVLAVIVWYLISKDWSAKVPRKVNPRKPRVNNYHSDKPSLSKAYYLLRERAFKYRYDVSRTTFDKLWKTNAPAAPFLYVQSFVPGVEWLLDPAPDSFAEEIDSLMSDLNSRRLFFAHSRWAVEALKGILDPRALSETSFPEFPAELEALPVVGPALTVLIQTKLRSYKSAYHQYVSDDDIA